MNTKNLTLFAPLLSVTLLFANAHAAGFSAQLNDPAWDGKSVPTGMQCQKFGGEDPKSPQLSVSGIPAGTNLIILEFNDQTYKAMDEGGHGKIGYALNQPLDSAVIPSVAGHSFTLPKGFFMVAAHRAPKWDKAGAYMPPCSGGKGNAYSVTIKAIQQGGDSAEVRAQLTVDMGRY